jgi:hypothetical protein
VAIKMGGCVFLPGRKPALADVPTIEESSNTEEVGVCTSRRTIFQAFGSLLLRFAPACAVSLLDLGSLQPAHCATWWGIVYMGVGTPSMAFDGT